VARPRTPLLSRRGIAEAALAIIDEDGLAGLSMRALARRLGVEAGSLYHHVDSREQLLDDVIALINEEVDLTPLSEYEDWRDALAVFARSYHRAFAAHPEMVSVAMQRPVQTPPALRLFDRESALLLDAGWDPVSVSAIVASVDHLVLGSALETFAGGFDRPPGDYAADYPVLSRVLAESDQSTLAPRSFELGLRTFLAGLGEPDGG
jgi:AcrR family transcriptional regulator